MQFRREAATDTILAVAKALAAGWTSLPANVQAGVRELVERYGHEIYDETVLNRASRVVKLLEDIAALPDLPSSVVEALAMGSGASKTVLAGINDQQRDQILAALQQIHDARRYVDPRELAESLRTRIAQISGQLSPEIAVRWQSLDRSYAEGGDPSVYLDEVAALLSARLDFVRETLERGKTWSGKTYRKAFLPPRPVTPGDLPSTGPSENAQLESVIRPSSLGLDGGSTASIPSVRRYANVFFPEKIQINQKMIPLVVHIAREAAEGVVTLREGSAALTVAVGDLSIFIHAEDFDVDLAIGGAEILAVPFGRSVRIEPSEDSEPVVFFLSPTATGDKRISVEFFQARKRTGSLTFLVTVVEQLGLTGTLGNARVQSVSVTAPSAGFGIKPPDLDLRVIRMGDGLTYGFVLDSADGRYTGKNLGQITLRSDPLAYFKSVVDELSSLASIEAGERTPSESRQIVSRLQQLGARLWDELLPADFKKEYHARLRQEYQGKSLVITSDEPWIPWEMVRPFELGPGGRPLYSDPPLCEQFRLTRWLSGNGAPDRLSVMRVVTIAPVDNLQSVEEEVAFFREMSQREARIKWIGPLLTLDDVDEELTQGTAQAFHFSCHGNFRYEDADESMLQFGDGFLRPSNIRFMEQIALWKSAPLVFVNACHSGQTGFTLTRMGGWAEAFLRVGASIFIGSLWEINDKLAAQFAREFYSRLWGLSGLPVQTIGEAFYGARMAIKQRDEANPTWLAYVLYSDPNARVEFGG